MGYLNIWSEVLNMTQNKHARAAVGVDSLPSGAAVEIELIAEVWSNRGVSNLDVSVDLYCNLLLLKIIIVEEHVYEIWE